MYLGIERNTARMPYPSDKVKIVVHEWFIEKPGKVFPHRINYCFRTAGSTYNIIETLKIEIHILFIVPLKISLINFFLLTYYFKR
jgi:hypothetical protein